MKERAGGPGDEPEDVAAGAVGRPHPAAPRGRRRRCSDEETDGLGARRRGGSRARPGCPLGCGHDRALPCPCQAGRRTPRPHRRGDPPDRGQGLRAWSPSSCGRRRRELLAEHYAEHEGKPFYEPLVEFMLSGPVAAMVLEGERCIEGFRSLAGATDPTVAAARHHPWRPRSRLGPEGPAEPRPRLGCPRVRRPRDRDLVPRAGA